MSKTRKFNRISLRLAWERSRNFATQPKVSLWNAVRGRNKEISHWWGVNTQFWLVLLLGFVSREGNLLQPIRSTTQIWVGSLTSWRKNIGNHVKSLLNTCRLPLMPTFSVLVLLIMMMIMWWWWGWWWWWWWWVLWCMLHGRYVNAGNFSPIIRLQQAASDLCIKKVVN